MLNSLFCLDIQKQSFVDLVTLECRVDAEKSAKRLEHENFHANFGNSLTDFLLTRVVPWADHRSLEKSACEQATVDNRKYDASF
jgi:hypothetical protein